MQQALTPSRSRHDAEDMHTFLDASWSTLGENRILMCKYRGESYWHKMQEESCAPNRSQSYVFVRAASCNTICCCQAERLGTSVSATCHVRKRQVGSDILTFLALKLSSKRVCTSQMRSAPRSSGNSMALSHAQSVYIHTGHDFLKVRLVVSAHNPYITTTDEEERERKGHGAT